MEIIKKNQSQVFNYDTITAYEYASKNKYININIKYKFKYINLS